MVKRAQDLVEFVETGKLGSRPRTKTSLALSLVTGAGALAVLSFVLAICLKREQRLKKRRTETAKAITEGFPSTQITDSAFAIAGGTVVDEPMDNTRF